jgi:hypothetical protein
MPRTAWNGFVKLRLGHSRKGSVFVVEHIFLATSSGWIFLEPSFFGPPSLSFTPRGRHQAIFSADVLAPRGSLGARLILTIEPKDLRKLYPGGSQLYWCRIDGPSNLAEFSAGLAQRTKDGDFALRLHHHTNDAGHDGITGSGHFRTSDWNLQGSRKLINVKHVYFTTLPSIETEDDLSRIAMASAGRLHFQTTEETATQILGMGVYRADTNGRTRTIEVDVPAASLAPPHLYYHPSVDRQPAYYEIIGPEILRIAMFPTEVVPIAGLAVLPAASKQKAFNYVVLGHAGTLAGLAAPYDEEATDEVMFLEDLPPGVDVFEFWRANQNSDLVTGRHKEVRKLEPS